MDSKNDPGGKKTVLPGRPRGRAVRWTPADLARLSAVTPADADAARADVRRLAPRPVKRLLG